MKIFVVIATYNEKDNIIALLNEILKLEIPEFRIIVVDDNSPDGTAALVQKFNHPAVELIVRRQERGYGSAQIRGFKAALAQGGAVVITMDADFSHSPLAIQALIKPLEAGYQVAVGSRRVAGGEIIGWGWFRKLASGTATILARVILGLKTHDATSGFRAYQAQALRQLNLAQFHSNGYSFLEELIYHCEKNNFKIKEVPIIFVDRKHGESKFSILEIMRFFITLFKLRFKIK